MTFPGCSSSYRLGAFCLPCNLCSLNVGTLGFCLPFLPLVEAGPLLNQLPSKPKPKTIFAQKKGAQRALPLVSDVAGGGEARRAVCERFPAPTCRKELGNQARLPNPPGSCLPALQAPGTAACPSRKPPPEPLILINQSPPEVLFFPELPLHRAVEPPSAGTPGSRRAPRWGRAELLGLDAFCVSVPHPDTRSHSQRGGRNTSRVLPGRRMKSLLQPRPGAQAPGGFQGGFVGWVQAPSGPQERGGCCGPSCPIPQNPKCFSQKKTKRGRGRARGLPHAPRLSSTRSRQREGGGGGDGQQRARHFLLMSLLKIPATKRSNCK